MAISDLVSAANPADLTALGDVPAAYRHEWRVATPREPLVLPGLPGLPGVPGAVFKWYHVHREGAAVPAELDATARATIADAAAGPWEMSYGLNVAQLHLSTTHAYLLAGVWRGHQELWQRPYWLDLAQGGPFTRLDLAGEDAPIGCAWELGVTCHERLAWHRYLFSARDEAAKRTWLTDVYAGAV